MRPHRLCRTCDGDGRVVDRILDDPLTGGTIAHTVECVDCAGSGWELVAKPAVAKSVVGWVTLVLAIVAAIALAVLVVSRPGPGPDPTAVPATVAGPTAGAGDPSASAGGASGPASSSAASPSDHAAIDNEAAVEEAETYQGTAAQADESHGSAYLALRQPRGTHVAICGAGGCWEDAVATDYGPDATLHPGWVADIAVARWAAICGLGRGRETCPVTVTILLRP